MSEDKPVIEVGITDVDSAFIEPGVQGGLRLLLCTNVAHDLALKIPAKVLAKLETKLAEAREVQAQMGGGRQ